MSAASDKRDRWLDRLQALGSAQAAYLWVLLMSCLFYAALKPTPGSAAASQVKAPILDLELDARFVAASGPVVISFLVLVIMGALRAYSHAREQAELGQGADFKGEEADVHPNALDLAFYTSKTSPRVMIVLTYFKYPVFLSAALVEAIWLWSILPDTVRRSAGASALALWVGATWQVGAMWLGRLKKVPSLWTR